MVDLEEARFTLFVLTVLLVVLYVPLLVLNRFMFLFVDERRAWVRVLRKSIGPKLPGRRVGRRELLGSAGRWLLLMLIGMCALAVQMMALELLSGETTKTLVFLLIPPTYLFVVVCFLDLAILVLRCLMPRWLRRGGEPSLTQGDEVTKPPNNTMNPTAGGRHTPLSRIGHSPAAGYGERWADR